MSAGAFIDKDKAAVFLKGGVKQNSFTVICEDDNDASGGDVGEKFVERYKDLHLLGSIAAEVQASEG